MYFDLYYHKSGKNTRNEHGLFAHVTRTTLKNELPRRKQRGIKQIGQSLRPKGPEFNPERLKNDVMSRKGNIRRSIRRSIPSEIYSIRDLFRKSFP
jgi:hypothetical protein